MAGLDETGLRAEGKLRWVHCESNGKYTLLYCHLRRGTKAMDAMGILPGFAGIGVHDEWAPYDSDDATGDQLCCAQEARELQDVADLASAGQWCWDTQDAEALADMQRLAACAIAQRHDAIDPAALAARVRRYRSAALIGIRETAARSGKLMKKHNALARRLLDRQDDYLRFNRRYR